MEGKGCGGAVLISLSFVIHPSLLSSLNTSQTVSADVPVSLPLSPDQFQFLTLLCLSLPFHFVVLCCVSAKSLPVSGHFLPAFHSVSFLVVSLMHVVNACLSVGVFYPGSQHPPCACPFLS